MQAPTRYQRGNNRQSTSSAQTPSTPAFGFTSTPAQPANAAPSQEPISFEKLDEASKKFILDVQTYMQTEHNISEEISARPTETMDQVAETADLLNEKLLATLNALQTDNQAAINLKKEYAATLRTVDSLSRIVERAKAGTDRGWMPQLPSKYFRDLLDVFERRKAQYRQTIESIDRFLETTGDQQAMSPQVLKDVMRNQYDYFIALSGEVAQLHESVLELQRFYLQERQKLGDNTNPFITDELKRKEEKRKKQMKLLQAQAATMAALQQQQQQQQQGQTSGTTSTTSFGFNATPVSSFGGTSTTNTFSFTSPTKTNGTTGTTSTTSTPAFGFGTPSTTTSTTTSNTSTTPATTGFAFAAPSTTSTTTGTGTTTTGTSTTTGTPAAGSGFSFAAPTATTPATGAGTGTGTVPTFTAATPSFNFTNK